MAVLATSKLDHLRALFAVPDYRRLWAIGAGVGLARWLEFLALAIYAYQLTGSAQLVALLAIARMVPYVAFGFLVGALADLFDRRRLLVLSFLGGAATSIVMTALALTGDDPTGAEGGLAGGPRSASTALVVVVGDESLQLSVPVVVRVEVSTSIADVSPVRGRRT